LVPRTLYGVVTIDGIRALNSHNLAYALTITAPVGAILDCPDPM
jgi:hypothetical protein